MFLSSLITGVGLGSMYGLLALGFYATYVVSNTVNFAQGSTMMLGAVLYFSFWVTFGMPMAVAIALALVGCGLWGFVVEQIAVRPFVKRKSEGWLMATVAVGIVLDNVVLFTFGRDPRGMPPTILISETFDFAGVRIQPQQVIVPMVGIGIAVALSLYSRRTRHGLAMLAVVQNEAAARLMGINVALMVSFAFVLSGVFAGVAGIVIAPLFNVSSTMGTLFGIKAFAVAILGGITSPWGVMCAGLIFGIAEAMITASLGSAYTQILTFSLVVLALVIRPNGLFGRAGVKKV